MTVWLRELAGWILLGTGVAAFGMCYTVFLLNRRIIEAAMLTFIAFIIFRGGLHLLKVATAARIGREANRQATAPSAPVRTVSPAPGNRVHVAPTAAKNGMAK